MPIYEYHCSHCQHQFDVLQKVQDEPVKVCPQCHRNTAVRLVSAAGFQLKGTGWYATDFKNKGSAQTSASDSSNKEKKTSSAAKHHKDDSN